MCIRGYQKFKEESCTTLKRIKIAIDQAFGNVPIEITKQTTLESFVTDEIDKILFATELENEFLNELIELIDLSEFKTIMDLVNYINERID